MFQRISVNAARTLTRNTTPSLRFLCPRSLSTTGSLQRNIGCFHMEGFVTVRLCQGRRWPTVKHAGRQRQRCKSRGWRRKQLRIRLHLLWLFPSPCNLSSPVLVFCLPGERLVKRFVSSVLPELVVLLQGPVLSPEVKSVNVFCL